jgi:hypothetical protein
MMKVYHPIGDPKEEDDLVANHVAEVAWGTSLVLKQAGA